MRSNYGFNYFNDNRWRFIGRDGSMGYRTGKVYRLTFTWFDPQPGETQSRLAIERTGIWRWLHGDGYCPYTNQDAFFDNWELAA